MTLILKVWILFIVSVFGIPCERTQDGTLVRTICNDNYTCTAYLLQNNRYAPLHCDSVFCPTKFGTGTCPALGDTCHFVQIDGRTPAQLCGYTPNINCGNSSVVGSDCNGGYSCGTAVDSAGRATRICALDPALTCFNGGEWNNRLCYCPLTYWGINALTSKQDCARTCRVNYCGDSGECQVSLGGNLNTSVVAETISPTNSSIICQCDPGHTGVHCELVCVSSSCVTYGFHRHCAVPVGETEPQCVCDDGFVEDPFSPDGACVQCWAARRSSNPLVDTSLVLDNSCSSRGGCTSMGCLCNATSNNEYTSAYPNVTAPAIVTTNFTNDCQIPLVYSFLCGWIPYSCKPSVLPLVEPIKYICSAVPPIIGPTSSSFGLSIWPFDSIVDFELSTCTPTVDIFASSTSFTIADPAVICQRIDTVCNATRGNLTCPFPLVRLVDTISDTSTFCQAPDETQTTAARLYAAGLLCYELEPTDPPRSIGYFRCIQAQTETRFKVDCELQISRPFGPAHDLAIRIINECAKDTL